MRTDREDLTRRAHYATLLALPTPSDLSPLGARLTQPGDTVRAWSLWETCTRAWIAQRLEDHLPITGVAVCDTRPPS
jgi:hypothetical protein